jgi:hypothetical protein
MKPNTLTRNPYTAFSMKPSGNSPVLSSHAVWGEVSWRKHAISNSGRQNTTATLLRWVHARKTMEPG